MQFGMEEIGSLQLHHLDTGITYQLIGGKRIPHKDVNTKRDLTHQNRRYRHSVNFQPRQRVCVHAVGAES